ncbi:CHAT domain protein [Rhizoctonia solani]|uniref:CHAT domain protein n=1 Tax=Rhizoctonia solani TaxID=456999 RepID=A0A8H8NTR1_9AGAM|nr:CHAT domain protein [Rhizoctonia solani]QRW18633.1 CHAT domain protein [Rhizoctonia solani]
MRTEQATCGQIDGPSYEDLCKQAKTHHDRFRRLGELDDIEKAIEYGNRALSLTPEEHSDTPNRLTCLGNYYNDRYRRLGKLEDMEKSFNCRMRALGSTSENDAELPVRMGDVGRSYTVRYRRLGDVDDLEKSLEHKCRALTLSPGDHPDLSDRHADLGVSYAARYQRMGDMFDLEKAIECHSRALALTPSDHPDLPGRHAALGILYTDRYQRVGDMVNLEKSIKYNSRALALTPNGHPDLPGRHAALGVSCAVRYRRMGDIADLKKSVEYNTRALMLTPIGHPDLPSRHSALGASYAVRYERMGDMADLGRAIECDTRALILTPDGHPDLPGRHAALGISYGYRYQRMGDMADLEKSIKYNSRALALTPDGHPDLPGRHAALGVSYTDRYRRMGDTDDLDKAIEYDYHALILTPDGHPDLPDRHAALGVSYTDRYRLMGDIADLGKAIECDTRALILTPDVHPDLSGRHAALGVSYTDRYRQMGDIADLGKAIECDTCALILTPDGHPGLPSRHAALGVSYSDRYQRMGEITDLEEAIECHSRALALTPNGHPDLPGRHAALGVSCIDRYRRMGDMTDLEKSIEHLSFAHTLTPDGHPHLPLRHYQMAISRHHQYQHTGHPSHLHACLTSFRRSSRLSSAAPREVFDYALRWANLASQYSYLNPLEAFRAALDVLPHFIWLGATIAQRYANLALTENLAIRAGAAAIRSSEYGTGLEWLEHGRCIVWNQTLMLRSPLDDLEAYHPAIAARLSWVSKQLDQANSGAPASRLDNAAPDPRYRLAREYNDLLTQARSLPGFEGFLRPPKAIGLMRVARHGPVVVINCSKDDCDALVIMPGQDRVGHVSLPSYTESKATHARSEIEQLLHNKGLRERGFRLKGGRVQQPDPDVGLVLADLWKCVVKPVLEYLGYLTNHTVDQMPHITWCPTGALTFLPLHAAGDYDQPGSRVFDHVISSYTPTLTALLASAPTVPHRAPRVLAVGQMATSGYSQLPGTARELASIRAHTHNRADYSQLIGSKATATAVLDAMEEHDWVHLACHAHQNVTDPTKSGFFLHGGRLDLAAITQRSFKSKGLAFLSACQTATGDEKLPDEAIHLASGMLMAGYRSVMATMWSVMDEDAPVVADMVYSQLMKDGKIGSGEAGRALHAAVTKLREKVGERNIARWVPYIHIGS